MINGANVPRADLLRHMQQIDADLRQGVRSAEGTAVYGTPTFVGDHVSFGATLKKYKQPTLGEMQMQCERDKLALEARDARWAQNGTWYTMGSVFGGMGLLAGGIALGASISTPLAIAGGVTLAVAGAASFGWGMWNVSGPNTYSKMAEIKTFERTLDHWGQELSSPTVTVPSASGPAVKVDPSQLTQMLSNDEKIRLAERLLEEVKAAQSKGTPTIARQDGKVSINGIQVPVKQ